MRFRHRPDDALVAAPQSDGKGRLEPTGRKVKGRDAQAIRNREYERQVFGERTPEGAGTRALPVAEHSAHLRRRAAPAARLRLCRGVTIMKLAATTLVRPSR